MPVPIYSASPISQTTASKAPEATSSSSNDTKSTSTAAPTPTFSTPNYRPPSAQPGASPSPYSPAPTPFSNPAQQQQGTSTLRSAVSPTRTSPYAPSPSFPVSPSRTPDPTQQQNVSPSSPQPATFPSSDSTSQVRRGSAIPPPPKTGEKLQPQEYYTPQPTPRSASLAPTSMPPQFGIPSPTTNQYATGTSTAPATPYGQQGRAQSMAHPPGYRQNPFAEDLTPAQRLENARQDGASPALGYQPPSGGYAPYGSGWNNAPSNPGFGATANDDSVTGQLTAIGGSIAEGAGKVWGSISSAAGSAYNNVSNAGQQSFGGGGGLPSSSEEGIWGSVSSWAKGAGKKLASVEGEVWRRVNGGDGSGR